MYIFNSSLIHSKVPVCRQAGMNHGKPILRHEAKLLLTDVGFHLDHADVVPKILHHRDQRCNAVMYAEVAGIDRQVNEYKCFVVLADRIVHSSDSYLWFWD